MNENDRAITGLVMVAHAMVHTYELSLPIFLGIWQSAFGSLHLPLVGPVPASSFVMGVVLTFGYAPFGLGALPGGVLADAYGSRRLIVACLAGMGGAFLALALSPGLAAVSLALLVWGVAASVYHPSGLALISTGVRARGRAFAYHGVAGNVGIALGPFLTAVMLFAIGDWRVVVAVLSAPALLGAVLAFTVEVDETAAVAPDGAGTAEPAPEADTRASGTVSSLPEFLADTRRLFAGAFVIVFAIVISSGLYYRGVLTFLPEILTQVPALTEVQFAGRDVRPERYVYAGLLMVGVLGQYVGGRLTDHIPVELGLTGAFAALCVLALLFPPVAATGLVGLLVVGSLVGVFLFAVQPLYQATVAEYTPPEARGVSYGYTYLGVFGVGALGGVVAGGLLTYFDSMALFAALAGFAGAAATLSLVLYTRR